MREGKAVKCLVILITASWVSSEKTVVCYYSSWATYRWSVGKFTVDDINVDLCTHVIYAFAGIDSQGAVVALDPYLDLPDNWGRDNYGAFTKLKVKNPKLKTILAVGGWNEGSAKYSVMASSAATRKTFISSAISILRTHGFDGLDIDWEYPNRRDTVHGTADVENFTQLLKEMRGEFDEYDLLLTAAVSSVREMASVSYNIPAISKYLDLINIMAYDMYGAWDPVTGHNAPLHKGIGDVGDANDLYTVDVALQYWISQGAPLEKLVLGVPLYGRTFTLIDSNAHSVRNSVSGPGISGLYTSTSGFIGYSEFCYKLKTEIWNQAYDNLAEVPYAYIGHDWVSYDDVNSITKKVEYAKSLNINNIMIWSIETDDFHNLCGGGDYPLLRAINTALDTAGTNTTTSVAPSSSTTTVSTSQATTKSTTTSTNPSTTVFTTPNSSTTVSTSVATTKPTTTSTTSSSTKPSTSVSTTSSSTTKTSTASTSSGSSTSTAATPTTICTEEGFAPNPEECTSFYMCVFNLMGGFTAVKFECPGSLHWDQTNQVCNYPSIANCKVQLRR